MNFICCICVIRYAYMGVGGVVGAHIILRTYQLLLDVCWLKVEKYVIPSEAVKCIITIRTIFFKITTIFGGFYLFYFCKSWALTSEEVCFAYRKTYRMVSYQITNILFFKWDFQGLLKRGNAFLSPLFAIVHTSTQNKAQYKDTWEKYLY